MVQRQFDLSDNSALRLTISQYFTPSGRLIQRDYKNKKNKDEYYADAMEDDETEGDNLNHTAEQDSAKPNIKLVREELFMVVEELLLITLLNKVQ